MDSIDLPQVQAGRTVRAKVDVSPQLRFLPAAEASRLQSVMNDVDVRLKLTRSGMGLGATPRLDATSTR